MEDIELYNFASDVLLAITKDLNKGLYSKYEIDLQLVFSTEDKISAHAKILDNGTHCIVISYELIKALYNDALGFCNFIRENSSNINFLNFFDGLLEFPLLPTSFTFEDNINNMFLNSLTWIYFHELGHLVQKHGVIRGNVLDIQEYNVNDDSSEVKNEVASLYHVTEIAADFYGVNIVIRELFRHWYGRTNLFLDSNYIFVCGITLCFYRFYGKRSLIFNSHPQGTHPHPIIRAELALPAITEQIDMIMKSHLPPFMDRKMLVHFLNRAGLSASLYWYSRYEMDPSDLLSFVMKGVLNREETKTYMRTIISTWDSISSIIETNSLDNNKFSLLQFSDQFRSLLK
ncbi:hypothetical protein [Acinetobacter sp. YH12233]|uniref:hypothetical protein n=1 Tax=Acinetobacter sp. YH12233 TaxID=2601161 RepID=UPI0015D1CED1|nr:hypothetical protein [Acinetobacter sp. YH12233]